MTGIDDHSRFIGSAKLVARAMARPVCQALSEALARHGIPDQILTDNGPDYVIHPQPADSSSS